MSSDLARSTYRQVQVDGSNKLQLVVMLYDGAIRFLGDAKVCLEKNNLRGRTIAINRALAVLGELQSTLKLEEGGELARSLDKLYTYMTSRILDANLKGDSNGIDESIRLLRTLNSAWAEIAQKLEREQVSSGATQPVHNPPPSRSSDGSLEFFG
jgi:flagellar protein FliS